MMINPKRGEIWQVDLEPTKGGEIRKVRPVVVISSDAFTLHNVRIGIPITGWKPRYPYHRFLIKIPKTSSNGLDKDSIGNILQIRSLAVERFIKKRGEIEERILQALLAGLVITVDY